MTLAETESGRRVKIVSVRCEKPVKRRLGDLGLFEGVMAKVVCRDFGVVIVNVMHTRLGLDEKILEEIDV